MNSGETAYGDIQSKLHSLRQREKSQELLTGNLLCLAVLVGTGFVLIILEAMFRLSSTIRIVFVMGYLGLGMWVLGWWVIKPLFSLLFERFVPDDDSLALRVGEVFPRIKDRLVDGLQVFRERTSEARGTSSSLALASLTKIYEEVKSLDFRRIISKDRLYQSARIVALICVVTAIGGGFFPRSLGGGFVRMSQPHKSFSGPAPFSIILHPGNVSVVQGEDVEISVEGEGEFPTEISLFLREGGEKLREIVLQKPFVYRIAAIRNSVDYSVQGGGVRTPTFRIEVVQRPMVRSLRVKLFPPVYAKLGIGVQEPNVGEVEGLKGTRVEVLGVSNNILSWASLSFEKGNKRKMSVRGREAVGEFVVKEDDRYWIELTDTSGLVNSDPISYAVRVRTDLDPVARILFPGKHVDLDEEMALPLTLEGEDDFGLSQCYLEYWKSSEGGDDSSEVKPSVLLLPLEKGEPSRVLLNYTWDMGNLELFPEDVVYYTFVVLDNDRISGPKRAQSRIFTVRFPSIYEIFQEVEAEQSDQIQNLTELYHESRDLQEELEHISEEMKGGKKLEWEDRKNLEGMTEKQRRMKEEVDHLRERLDNLVDRMERNDVLNIETLEKYQELQKLYEELSSPELLEALEKFQEAVSQVSEEALRKVMDQFKLSQENFLKSIERTISLLKRLRVEQKTDELVKRIEDLVERQGALNQELARERPEELSELIENEREIREDTEAFRQEMEKLFKMMEELSGMPLSQLEAAMNMIEQRDLVGQLTRMEQMMNSGQLSQAGTEGAGAKRTMSSLADMLSKMQESLQRNQKERITQALKRIAHRLLQLSKGQEDLMVGTQEGRVTGNQAAETQLSLLSGLSQMADSLVQLSRQTFFVTPEMGRAMGEAQAQMRQAIQGMEPPGRMNILKNQGKAMGALNQAVMAIQSSMEQMASSQSGLGMEQFLLQMEQVAQQQEGINQQTMDLLQKGQLTLAQQASMARLAAEQEAVKKTMEELLREFGDRSEVMGRLDQMVKDMEEVVRELKQNKVNSETIRRQERILSRLLDAQRSVRRRDYSQKRQARSGDDVIRKSPEALPIKATSLKDRIRRDILRLAKEGYTKDYQELIRRYFEVLAQEEKK